MTKSTSGMSSPRAATSVVTRTRHCPSRKLYNNNTINVARLRIHQCKQNILIYLSSNLEHFFPLGLRNITMHDLCLLLDVRAHSQSVGIFLCLTEHHSAPMTAAVHWQHVAYSCRAVVVETSDRQVLQHQSRIASLQRAVSATMTSTNDPVRAWNYLN